MTLTEGREVSGHLMLEAALTAFRAGLSVLPPKEDGSKAPDTLEWTSRQVTRATEEEIRRWYSTPRHGLGIVCGAVSGGLEMFEFEGRAVTEGIYDEFLTAAEQSGLGRLVVQIATGYSESTPLGGIHWFYRCSQIQGNEKLARRPSTEEELAHSPLDRVKVLMETRGEGGYAVVAPSCGSVHASGVPWVLIEGGFESIITITPEERAELHRLARGFDQMPKPQPSSSSRPEFPSDGKRKRPGDDFNERTVWGDLLEPRGWRRLFTTRGGNEHWCRPGKERGTSATISHDGEGVLYVFSSSTPFEPDTSYSKFGAYAVLEHGGDYRAAAAALRDRGFGEDTEASTPVERKLQVVDEPREEVKEPTSLLKTPLDAYAEHQEMEAMGGIKLGIDDIDRVIAPGLRATQVMIVLARSGTGKTLLLLNLFQHMVMAQPDLKILFVSLEQTAGDWWERVQRIHRFYNLDDDDQKILDFWHGRLRIVDENKVDYNTLIALILEAEQQMGRRPDVVAIDYLGYWAQSFGTKDAYEQTTNAMMALKSIAKKYKVAIIAPHQVNRNTGPGEEPSPDDARNSGGVLETADFMFTMWNPDDLLGTDPADRRYEIHLRMVKSRHGGVGVRFSYQFGPITLAMVPKGDPLCARVHQEREWRRLEEMQRKNQIVPVPKTWTEALENYLEADSISGAWEGAEF